MRRFLLHLLLVSCLYLVNGQSEAETLRQVKLYYPENIDGKGKHIPITPEVLRVFDYFERQANVKFSIVTLPWKRAQREVLRGEGIIYGFSKSTERLAQYRYSAPVLSFPLWAISYGEENAQIADLNDLKNKVVVASVGISHGIEYERARNVLFTVQEDYLSYQERFKKLLTKRCDVILIPFNRLISRDQIDQALHEKIIASFNDPELNGRRFNVSLNPIFVDTIHFASAKQQFQDVIERIDKAIERGSKDGSLSKLLKNY
jgi:ABC-type amino acid transport substrate-binding protein